MTRLAFRRLRIDRYLGITSGYELRDLAPGVNVVYGPNASGKTTTARAIETLLWTREARPHGVIVEALMDVAGETWSVRVNADRVDYERGGLRADPLVTAPAEGRDRYRLWLADLLQAEDEEFARRIVIESAGGYDLRKAAEAAFSSRRATSRRGRPHDDLQRARKEKAEATAAAAALEEERATLAEKEARLKEQPVLLARARACRLSLDLIGRRAALADALAKHAIHPPILARLQGNEVSEVALLRKRIADAHSKADGAEAERMEALRRLQQLRLPSAIVEGDLFHRLVEDLEQLLEVDQTLEQLRRNRESATARVVEVERRLGQVDRVRAAEIDPGRLGDLLQAGRQAESARQKRMALEVELEGVPDAEPPRDLEQSRQGVQLLKEWLAARDRNTPSERLWLAALLGVGAGLFGGLVTMIWGPTWFGVLVVVVVAVAGGVLHFERKRSDLRTEREQAYLRLGLLLAPESWEAPVVQACVAELEAYIANGQELEQAWSRRRHLETRLDAHLRSSPEPDPGVMEIAENFGLRLPDDTIVVHSFVEDLIAWRKARDDQKAAEAEEVALFARRQEVLEGANRRLGQIGRSMVRESRSFKGTVEKLREDLESHRELTRALTNAKSEKRQAEEAAAEHEAALERIRERAGFGEDDEHLLAEWCAAVPTFREDAKAVTVAESQLRLVQDQMTEIPDFDRKLSTLPAEELKAEIRRVEEELAELQRLAQSVGSLTTRIDTASSAHTLEAALAAEHEALSGLRELRARSLRSAVADTLVEFVDRETRRAHQPTVLQRANELLGVITRHAYELRVDDVHEGAFRAIDRRSERGHSLDQLSNGTRVQLLLAVRLAFVESLETGVALPLLMDETLANSDDERAAAIMEAVIRFAEAGRQVFYFTAQPDEVAKWSRALEAADVEWTRIDLAEVRALDGRLDPAVPSLSPPPPPPTIPRDARHEEIPRYFPVPRLSLDDPIAAAHPWYFTEDVELLRHLVEDLHVTSWGELSALIETSSVALFEPALRERLFAAAGAMRSVIAALRVGRGGMVDRVALVDSGAVTDRFLDEVDALRERLDGDGVRLIEALEDHVIKGFRQRNAEELRAFFEERGLHDARPSLDFAGVRRRVIAERAGDVAVGVLTPTVIDSLILRVARGAGVNLDPPSAPPSQIVLL